MSFRLPLILATALAAWSAAAGAETIKIGVTPGPHAQILEAVKPVAAKQGLDIQLIEFSDYVVPNAALDAGEIQANSFQLGFVGAIVQRVSDPLTDLLHFRFFHPARCESGCSNADSARLHRRIGVERNRVLVDRNAGIMQRVLGFAAQHAFGKDVDQHQVRVGPS